MCASIVYSLFAIDKDTFICGFKIYYLMFTFVKQNQKIFVTIKNSLYHSTIESKIFKSYFQQTVDIAERVMN